MCLSFSDPKIAPGWVGACDPPGARSGVAKTHCLIRVWWSGAPRGAQPEMFQAPSAHSDQSLPNTSEGSYTSTPKGNKLEILLLSPLEVNLIKTFLFGHTGKVRHSC